MPALLLQFQAHYVQLVQNGEYLHYGLSNGKHR